MNHTHVGLLIGLVVSIQFYYKLYPAFQNGSSCTGSLRKLGTPQDQKSYTCMYKKIFDVCIAMCTRTLCQLIVFPAVSLYYFVCQAISVFLQLHDFM